MGRAALFLTLICFAPALPAADLPPVIINEIHYHPPGDAGLREEFVELYNRTDRAVDLHGWRFTDGITCRFDRVSGPASIPPKSFLLVARDPAGLARIAGIPAARIAGPYRGKLSNFKDRLALVDPRGKIVEVVEYSEDGLWPARADGLGASLQRISSEAPGNLVQNWAVYSPSLRTENPRGVSSVNRGAVRRFERRPLSRPGDVTPGRANSVASPALPPLVAFLERVPREPRSRDPVVIRARVEGSDVARAALIYDLGSGERSTPLTDDGRAADTTAGDGIYAGEIPPASDRTVVRFRIAAYGRRGGVFHFPREGNPSPHAGYYVLDQPRSGNEDLEVYHLLWNGRLSCAKGAWLRGCTFVYRGTAYLNVGLKYRGLTSCGMPKSGLKIDFNRGDLFRGQKQLNLLGCWQDRSLLRERLAWDFFRDIGHPHCQVEMAAVYAAGNRFHGLFVALEAPGKSYLRRNGLSTRSTLWKCTSSFLGAESAGRGRFSRVTKSEAADQNEAALREFEHKLNSLTGREHLEYVLEHIDVEALIEYQTVKCLISDEDAYTKNWFLRQDAAKDAEGNAIHRFTVHPWDLDLSFGQYSLNEEAIHTDRQPLAGTVDHPRRGSHGLRWNGLLEAVFGRKSRDYFVKALYGRIWRALEEEFHPAVLGEKIDRLDANTSGAARADLERWPRWGIEPRDPDVHRQRLRGYVAARYVFLRTLLTTDHRTTASAVGSWGLFPPPRVARGKPPPPATAYRTFRYTPAPRMKITEIHYNPPNDEGREFIEIRNLEEREVDLSGWNLPAVGFVFPDGSKAPAGGTFLVARSPAKLIALHADLSRRLV
ncbi:MAG: CotH kinase family protein, partial [bacterium]